MRTYQLGETINTELTRGLKIMRVYSDESPIKYLVSAPSGRIGLYTPNTGIEWFSSDRAPGALRRRAGVAR